MNESINSSKDTEWKTHILCRLSELEPKIFGEAEPSIDDAMVYFKFHQILNDVFFMGRDYSQHIRNPMSDKNKQKKLDTETKLNNTLTMTDTKLELSETEHELVKFLQDRCADLHDFVFATDKEPEMIDRMTFFAYNQCLVKKYKTGKDYKNSPRNPWKDSNAPDCPIEFADYGQIRQVPKHLITDLTKTQVIPLPPIGGVEATKSIGNGVTPLPSESVWEFRVFDIDHPNRTVFQGEEGEAYRYVAKANKDSGYKAFDYVGTNRKIIPREKREKQGGKTHGPYSLVHQPRQTQCGCDVRKTTVYNYGKSAKTKVQEYLERTRAIKVIEETEVK